MIVRVFEWRHMAPEGSMCKESMEPQEKLFFFFKKKTMQFAPNILQVLQKKLLLLTASFSRIVPFLASFMKDLKEQERIS